MADLSHPNDSKFGKSWFSRIFVYLGLVLVWIPIILVFQDVTNNKDNAVYDKEYYKVHNGTTIELD